MEKGGNFRGWIYCNKRECYYFQCRRKQVSFIVRWIKKVAYLANWWTKAIDGGVTLQGQWHSEQRVKKDVRPYFPGGGWLQWVVGRWVSRFSTGSWVNQLAGKVQAVSWTSVRWNPGKCRCKWIMIQRCRKLETKSMRLNKETLYRPIYCCCLADDLAKSGVLTGP